MFRSNFVSDCFSIWMHFYLILRFFLQLLSCAPIREKGKDGVFCVTLRGIKRGKGLNSGFVLALTALLKTVDAATPEVTLVLWEFSDH